MRIAFVNQDAGIDPEREKGAAVHLVAMRRAFRQLGAEVVAIDEPDTARVRGELERQLSAGTIDLIYERYSAGGHVASQVARARGIPHVLEVNAPLVEETCRYRPDRSVSVDPEDEQRMFSNAHVLAVSAPLGAYARDRGTRPERVHVLPNAVDTELFRPRTDDSLRMRLVPEGRLVLGMHGRMRAWHNVAMLIRVVGSLRAEGAPLFLLVAGHGEGLAALESLPPESHCLVPWCPHEEVGALVACFDAIALTYLPQTEFYFSPLKLFEAMACGAVPIVPDLGDLPEHAVHGETGLVYPAGDEAALAGAVRSLIDDVPLRLRLQHGAASSMQDRSWVALARQVLERVGRAPR